ncbi:PQQ-binding-like beta-propeller repeat protein [Haloarcula montana]|uniref:PQQ-binding-like beta-propeller repeat protein n=1 Tax=Haloarcula montana TaxID=3111776 RepID=UPI002D780438|nr:PQQ-binding-like beta-propeller repeat protein [Haloarcula sp. GH36]
MRRRDLLAAGATALSTAVAGCSSDTTYTGSFEQPTDRWPAAGYGPAGTSHAPAGPDAPTEQWTLDREAMDPPLYGYLGEPAVGDAVYVAGMARGYFDADRLDSVLAALSPETGDPLWTHTVTEGITGAPAIVGSTVVVGTSDGRLLAVEDGEVAWTAQLDGAGLTPAVFGDRFYVPDGSGALHCIDRSGSARWTASRRNPLDGLLGDDDPIRGAVPAVDSERIYTAFSTGDRDTSVVAAFDHSGLREWRLELQSERGYGVGPRGLALADGTLYLSHGGTVTAVDAAGELDWEFVTGYDSAGPPATDGDRVYVAAKNLYALDTADGTERWRVVNESVPQRTTDINGVPFLARPAIADGTVYFRAAGFDPEDGSRRWGSDADSWADSGEYFTDPYDRVPMANLAVTADGLYLTHAVRGVQKFA